MRHKFIYLLIALFFIYVATAWWTFVHADAAYGVFIIQVITSVSTLMAVLVALFGDLLRECVVPIRLRIEVPAERNNVFDQVDIGGSVFDAYCHHLQVRNLTSYRPVRDCTVWLTRIFQQSGADGKWEENVRFAVPRLMLWAPFEYSGDKRTFSSIQVFDLGKTVSHNKGFLLDVWKSQGGNFDKTVPVGGKRGFVFKISAENYLGDDEFYVELMVLPSNNNKCVPSEVSVVIDPTWLTVSA